MPVTSGRTSSRYLVVAGVAGWITLWIAVGITTGVQIRRLGALSDSVVESGRALDTAGRALQDVAQLPIIGERTQRLGDEVRQTAGEIQTAGASSRVTVRWVSTLLAGALILIPTVSVLAMYAPIAIARRRDRRAVERALREPVRAPWLEQFLAHHAVLNIPYDTLREVSADPWGDLERGAYRKLANAELTRLGLAGTRRARRWAARHDRAASR
ncbi:MAG: hypothetical protein ACLGI2_00050 [Acidimicrobiia bacterium]